MRCENTDSDRTNAAAVVGGWLATNKPNVQLLDSGDAETLLRMLPDHTVSERFMLLRSVLGEHPLFAQAVRGLSVHDQLRLSLDMLHGTNPPPPPPEEETIAANILRFRGRGSTT